MEIAVRPLRTRMEDEGSEIVERKGLGHPDSLCDALAEELSLSLSRFYLERFGTILHHNVDKVLLRGGMSRPRFGGGEMLRPIEIYLCGRAAFEHRGVEVPVERLAVEGSREWLRRHLPALDPGRDVAIHSLVRPGSRDLVELYARAARQGRALANDTSCGAGYAPLSRLETAVMAVDRALNRPETKAPRPWIGEDVKVMGFRHGDAFDLTVACAFIDRHVRDLDDYGEKTSELAELAREAAARAGAATVSVRVNTADDPAAGSVYLTVTGTSAEAGDDGQAGRGNRANGLIAPYRPMTMESVAGKNPVSHVGKLYNIAAGLLAARLVEALPEIGAAEVYLVGRIGAPVTEPALVDIRIATREGAPVAKLTQAVKALAGEEIGRIGDLWRDLLDGTVRFDRWPLRAPPIQPG